MRKHNQITVGLVAARKNSKGVKNKNLIKIKGKPITKIATELAIKCKKIDHVILSSDSDKILNLINHKKLLKIKRKKILSKDNTPMLPVILNAIKYYERTYKKTVSKIVLFDPTAPLRKIKDINQAINLFNKKKPDLLISAHESSHNPYFSVLEKKGRYYRLSKHYGKNPGSRQSVPEVFDVNTIVWIYSKKAVVKIKKRVPKKTIILKTDADRSIDIDTKNDIKRIKYFLKKNI